MGPGVGDGRLEGRDRNVRWPVLEPLDHPIPAPGVVSHADALQETTLRASASNAARKLCVA